MDEVISYQQRQNWIARLPKTVRDEVSACLVTRQYKEGDFVYAAGQVGNELYQVRAGVVRLFTLEDDGRELLWDLFATGICFGETSLIDDEPRPHSAQAMNDCVVNSLSRADFSRLWRTHPEVSIAVAQLLSARSRRLYGVYRSVSLNVLSARMADRLVSLAETCGHQRADGIHFGVRITQEAIGNLVVGSRQSVNRILRQWQNEGVIELNYGSVVILNLNALRKHSDAIG